MAHKHLTISALAHLGEGALCLLHLFDVLAPDTDVHIHEWKLQGEPVRTRNHLVIVECCSCGAVRCDRVVHDANQGCFRRMGTTLVS